MKIKWLGHSAFQIELKGQTILIDPFLRGNATFSPSFIEGLEKVDAIVLTHGHSDHIGDTMELAERFGSKIFGIFEIASYLSMHDIENIVPMNIGGTVELSDGVTVSLVNAVHSASMIRDGRIVYMGQPAGVVIASDAGAIYHAGDTDIFSDMALIQKIHKPDIALLPIGGRFTMSASVAAMACNDFLDVQIAIPMHYGTFPVLNDDPQAFVSALTKAKGVVLKPGACFEPGVAFSKKKP